VITVSKAESLAVSETCSDVAGMGFLTSPTFSSWLANCIEFILIIIVVNVLLDVCCDL